MRVILVIPDAKILMVRASVGLGAPQVVCCKPTPLQVQLYNHFIGSKAVQKAMREAEEADASGGGGGGGSGRGGGGQVRVLVAIGCGEHHTLG